MRRYLILLVGVSFLGLASSPRASAQASQPYVGEVVIVAFNFAPQNWASCNGQLLSIAENDALFALIGTTYGGDGVSTFALPDLRGRVPIHQGQGPGLNNYILGQTGGQETVTLSINQMPAHEHTISGQSALGATSIPTGSVWASQSKLNVYSSANPDTPMNPASVSTAGGNQAHDNRSPFLTLNYIISLFGIFPSQG
jgi:microcystin-dependent protein